MWVRVKRVASFPGPLREFRTASDERAGPGNEAIKRGEFELALKSRDTSVTFVVVSHVHVLT